MGRWGGGGKVENKEDPVSMKILLTGKEWPLPEVGPLLWTLYKHSNMNTTRLQTKHR